MDRNRARANLVSGLRTAAIALAVFALAFYASILYIQ